MGHVCSGLRAAADPSNNCRRGVMSGANEEQDPMPGDILAPETLRAAIKKAETDFDAVADLDALAAVKPAHLGDQSPLLLARREIGALPKKEKAEAGKLVNEAPHGRPR